MAYFCAYVCVHKCLRLNVTIAQTVFFINVIENTICWRDQIHFEPFHTMKQLKVVQPKPEFRIPHTHTHTNEKIHYTHLGRKRKTSISKDFVLYNLAYLQSLQQNKKRGKTMRIIMATENHFPPVSR